MLYFLSAGLRGREQINDKINGDTMNADRNARSSEYPGIVHRIFLDDSDRYSILQQTEG